jgi:DNA-directed RNA polymerase subunit RPC12/RpoP
MEIKNCSQCHSEMSRNVIKAVDSHNNFVEYECKKCGHKTSEIEHIGA